MCALHPRVAARRCPHVLAWRRICQPNNPDVYTGLHEPASFYNDCTDRERNTPLGWVDLSIRKFGKRANAAVLVADEAGIGMWRLGRVFRYDAKSSSFYVHLCSDFGQLLDDSALVARLVRYPASGPTTLIVLRPSLLMLHH